MSEENIKKVFSKNLNYYLTANDKTQKDLFQFMNVSSATASDWCNGKKLPRMDKIQSISNWFGIDNSDLLEEKEQTDPNQFYREKRLLNSFRLLSGEMQDRYLDLIESNVKESQLKP